MWDLHCSRHRGARSHAGSVLPPIRFGCVHHAKVAHHPASLAWQVVVPLIQHALQVVRLTPSQRLLPSLAAETKRTSKLLPAGRAHEATATQPPSSPWLATAGVASARCAAAAPPPPPAAAWRVRPWRR